MLEQLGIRQLRPGRNADASKPNAANYDEALANPFPILPDVLRLKSGARVATAEQWWSERRPEIVEDFEREVVGRVPADVPSVEWSVAATREWEIGGRRVVGRDHVRSLVRSRYCTLRGARGRRATRFVDARPCCGEPATVGAAALAGTDLLEPPAVYVYALDSVE